MTKTMYTTVWKNSKLHAPLHTPLSLAAAGSPTPRQQTNKTKQSMLFVPPVSPSTVRLDSFFRRRHTKDLTVRESSQTHTQYNLNKPLTLG